MSRKRYAHRLTSLVAMLPLFLILAVQISARALSGFDEITLENVRLIQQLASADIAPIFDLAWSPDGTEIAVATDNGFWIYDWRANFRDRFEAARNVSRVAFIPNTSHLAVSFGDETGIYDARFEPIATFPYGFQAISPDGSMFAASDSEHITLYSLQDGSILQQVPIKVLDNCLGGCAIFDMAFSPDGRYLAFTAPVEAAESGIVDLATSENLSSVELGMNGLTFSSDSILIVSWEGQPGYHSAPILLTDSRTGQAKASIQNLYGDYAAPAFSRDGRLLIVAGTDRTQGIPYETQGMLLYAFDVAQVLEQQVVDDRFEFALIDDTRRKVWISSTVFSPDYRLLAVGDSYGGQVTVWGVPTTN